MVPLVRYRKVTLVVQNILSMISTVPYGNVMYRTLRIYLFRELKIMVIVSGMVLLSDQKLFIQGGQKSLFRNNNP